MVAASAHAGCERYRHTDPMITGESRRALAARLGYPDTTAGIPEARWMRAMTFEALVRHDRFVSQLLTTAVGQLDLARPVGVRRANGRVKVATTVTVLHQAHLKAMHEGVATMITGLALPFVGREKDASATPVKPDFAIVVPRHTAGAPEGAKAAGTWLIMGDAKDYERVRSRIDDQRMLKGFLQVAVGAVSARAWSRLPEGMTVHEWGALAVPRNAFLQPVAVVEDLRDHCAEVMARVGERERVLADHGGMTYAVSAPADLEHLAMAYDPGSCRACALHQFCLSDVRRHPDPVWRLIEIGIPVAQRAALIEVVEGSGDGASARPSALAQVRATLNGVPEWTGARRTDPLGLPGTVNLVLAKADAAALGVHGIALQVVTDQGARPWDLQTFADPQSPDTRRELMERVGQALGMAIASARNGTPGGSGQGDPVHIVVPDGSTADLLVSVADSLAGIEISRLRWARDLAQGRPTLTYDGEPAVVPAALSEAQRLAVSFLLEADRNRAMTLRSALVDARAVLSSHVVVGGARFESLRLDYVVAWAEATGPVDHRQLSDAIAADVHTPGARLSNVRSDQIHAAMGMRGQRIVGDYDALVRDELGYKADVLERVVQLMGQRPVSRLRAVHRALEADAQTVWQRRLSLHASDLVRFGRVSWWWRNDQVTQIDADRACGTQLLALGDPHAAADMASDAGTREVAQATVVATAPLRVRVRSRRLGAGSLVWIAHSVHGPSVELPSAEMKILKGSFKFSTQTLGSLEADEQTVRDGSLLFSSATWLGLPVGSEVVLIDGGWVNTFKNGSISVNRPSLDLTSAPKAGCDPDDYARDPDSHGHCCRPHESQEAETSDYFAQQRSEGKMNPQVWPPLVDYDAFDTPAVGSPTGDPVDLTTEPVPADLTIDDVE